MKKTLLSMALMAVSGTAIADDYYNGRLTGMSGAGFATSNYADGVVYNPSLIAKYGKRDDFALVGNGGVSAADEEGLIDGFEDLTDYLDDLEQRTSSNSYWEEQLGNFDPNDPDALLNGARELQEEEAEEAIRRLEGIANKSVDLNSGGSIVMAIPNDLLPMSIVSKNRIEASVLTIVDENDYDYIREFVGQTDFDPAGLQSYGVARGAAVSEVGLAIAKSLKTGEDSELLIGATPKWMHVATFVYTANVDNFDEDDFDGDDYTVEHDDVNLDLGATYLTGKMRYALTVSNLISNEYETIIPGDRLKLAPRATAAIGYESDWLTAEFASDLNASPNFATGEDTQWVRAGIEFNLADWVQLRGGMRSDLQDNRPDTMSIGAGFSPFNVVNLDFSLFAENLSDFVDSLGDDESDDYNGGFALQVGVRF